MRIKMKFELENTIIPIEYRKFILSFIKKAVEEYNKQLYEKLYTLNQKKTYCFSVILPKPIFHQETVELSNNKFEIIFSFYHYAYMLHFYNAFLSQKFKKFSIYKNSITLTNLNVLPEKEINTNHIIIKMSSPLVVRNHNRETKKDWYYSYETEPEFSKFLKINIEEQMHSEGLDKGLLKNFEIIPVDAKKTVIKNYGLKLEVSLGYFLLKGNPELLSYLYKAGMGAKRPSGFRIV